MLGISTKAFLMGQVEAEFSTFCVCEGRNVETPRWGDTLGKVIFYY